MSNWKQYRHKGTIDARVVDRDIKLPDGREIKQGDYETLEEGVLVYNQKEIFESEYELARAPRVKPSQPEKKKKA